MFLRKLVVILTLMSKNEIRSQFPILSPDFNSDLIYLDNTATTQKPRRVIDAMTHFLEDENATVHRGIYGLSQKATARCDGVREQVGQFINASRVEDIVFTKGTTESINLVAHSYARAFIQEGQEILITAMEHHANIVPWQQVCDEKKATLVVCPILDSGDIDLDVFKSCLSSNTFLVAFTHISNVLGTINPVSMLCELVRAETDAKILIDGAQAIAHQKVDVQAIDCDFYCFSGHKMYGPTGIGVLYGRYEILSKMVPFQTGGDMIEFVTFDKTTFTQPPSRFEAGTPAIVEIIGLGAAMDFLNSLGMERIESIETGLRAYSMTQLSQVTDLQLVGTSKEREGIFSFMLGDIHPHDVGTILDSKGIAVRVGHHCAQPIMKHYKIPGTARMSFAIYNTKQEIDSCITAIKKAQKMLA